MTNEKLTKDEKTLTKKLNYTFKEPQYLKTALTHRSHGVENNERLEFLGDAVVNFVIGDLLYRQFPEATEGELSRFRATLVNRNTLADLGKAFELGQYLFLGQGEKRSGGHERHSILSCAMEAVIGAVFLDGGYESAYQKIADWYEPLLKTLTSAENHKDPKTLLQEYLQSHRFALPVYHVAKITGEAHKQEFTVECRVAGLSEVAEGRGTSRRRAEQEAALAMLGKVRK